MSDKPCQQKQYTDLLNDIERLTLLIEEEGPNFNAVSQNSLGHFKLRNETVKNSVEIFQDCLDNKKHSVLIAQAIEIRDGAEIQLAAVRSISRNARKVKPSSPNKIGARLSRLFLFWLKLVWNRR